MKIKWNKSAVKQLLDVINFLEQNDFQDYAINVETEILTLIRNLPDSFQRYPQDLYKLNNDGTYRAFEFERYRVSFRATMDEIRILRIRHTSRIPKKF